VVSISSCSPFYCTDLFGIIILLPGQLLFNISGSTKLPMINSLSYQTSKNSFFHLYFWKIFSLSKNSFSQYFKDIVLSFYLYCFWQEIFCHPIFVFLYIICFLMAFQIFPLSWILNSDSSILQGFIYHVLRPGNSLKVVSWGSHKVCLISIS
jgi:hypothetical protein